MLLKMIKFGCSNTASLGLTKAEREPSLLLWLRGSWHGIRDRTRLSGSELCTVRKQKTSRRQTGTNFMKHPASLFIDAHYCLYSPVGHRRPIKRLQGFPVCDVMRWPRENWNEELIEINCCHATTARRSPTLPGGCGRSSERRIKRRARFTVVDGFVLTQLDPGLFGEIFTGNQLWMF